MKIITSLNTALIAQRLDILHVLQTPAFVLFSPTPDSIALDLFLTFQLISLNL